MSGPKVVRIVTREEIISICQGLLAQLDEAIAGWIRDGRRHETIDDNDITATARRRDQIAALLKQDRFMDLQKAVPAEISFILADRQARLDRAAQAAAEARSTARREAEAAKALLAALERHGTAMPAATATALREAAAGRGGAASALSAGFALLSAPAPVTDRTQLNDLARKLKDETQDRSLDAWLARQPAPPDDVPLRRIEARLAELIALAGAEPAAGYEARLSAVRAEASADRRQLLFDSLALDLGKSLTEARLLADLRAKLGLALAELQTLSMDRAAGFRGEVATQQDIEARLAAVQAAVASERDALAAAARRHAVLEGLAALGYEVGEQLSTAWVQDGRITVRQPARPGYGVEVVGAGNAERLQMRVVAFDGTPDPARDRDAETLWCSDVDGLRQKLAAAGTTITVERALPVGAAPVKRIETGERAVPGQRRSPAEKTRR